MNNVHNSAIGVFFPQESWLPIEGKKAPTLRVTENWPLFFGWKLEFQWGFLKFFHFQILILEHTEFFSEIYLSSWKPIFSCLKIFCSEICQLLFLTIIATYPQK